MRVELVSGDAIILRALGIYWRIIVWQKDYYKLISLSQFSSFIDVYKKLFTLSGKNCSIISETQGWYYSGSNILQANISCLHNE